MGRGRTAVGLATLLVAAGTVMPGESRAADPRCFGAAARDPQRPCENRQLRLKVTPTPDQAQVTPNLVCRGEGQAEVFERCAFGLEAEESDATVAIIGDSHAAHWRAALAVVARAKRWRMLEVSAPHCPLSLAAPDSGPEVADWCPRWNRRVLAGLAARPEIKTVFLSSNARAPIVVPDGRTEFATRVSGYARAWRLLPASVEQMIVIRDNPIDRIQTFECVRRATTRRRPAGPACGVSRRHALPPDAAVAAAKRLPDRNARVIDLSRQFCTGRVCLPVVGGVLVHKDVDHLTQLFARTLGPFLLRGVNAALAPGQ